MFKFKGGIITKWERYRRWKILHGAQPLTRDNLLDLELGDTVLLIKRNETTDVIALSCGLDGTQPANEIAVWRVVDKGKYNVFLKNEKDGRKTLLSKSMDFIKEFNRLIVKPNFLSEDYELRMYYKRFGQ
jgi:hypothetical protein